jgi:hypothetical protein
MPGGGPEDKLPPRLVRVSPESGATNQRPGSVVFYFDETINDRTQRGELSQYFLVSPSDGRPRINWHRGSIRVRPRGRFRDNTAYSVTLLPGLADLRGNAMRDGASVVFSTGATLPRFGISGHVYDWEAERPAQGAIVQAIARVGRDSVVYLAVTDSLGWYDVGPFDSGSYELLGFIDRNGNLALDPGEPWDRTVQVVSVSRPVKDLLAIVKDTIPPRIASLARDDSISIRVSFDRPLDPGQRLGAENFRVQTSDSNVVAIASVMTAREAQRVADSAARKALTPADSAARADSIARAAARPGVPPSIVPIPAPARPPAEQPSLVNPPLPRPSQPPPERAVVLKLAPPTILHPGTYRVTASDIRNLLNRTGTSTRTFTIQRPATPNDSTKAAPVRRPGVRQP